MKLLFLSSSYATFIPGHWQNFSPRHWLAKDLVEKGHEVFVVTPQIDETVAFEEQDGVKIYRFGKKMQVDFRKIGLLQSAHYFWKFYRLAKKIAKEEKIDAIHAFWAIPAGIVANQISGELKIPYLVELLGNDVFMALDHPISKIPTRMAIANADYVTADGWSLIDYSKNKGIQMSKVWVHFYEVDMPKLEETQLDQFRKKWNIQSSDKIITINRIKLPHYGAQYVFDALPKIAEKVPGIKLLMVGSAGNYQQTLDEQIDQASARKYIIPTGYLNRNELPAAYQLADIYINPSLSDSTSVGLLEAMYLEMPVVASDIGDNKYWIKSKDYGIIVKPESADEIADAVIELFTEADLDQIGKNNRKRAQEECDNDKMVNEQEAIYKELVPNK